jgi:hypothetical protein
MSELQDGRNERSGIGKLRRAAAKNGAQTL